MAITSLMLFEGCGVASFQYVYPLEIKAGSRLISYWKGTSSHAHTSYTRLANIAVMEPIILMAPLSSKQPLFSSSSKRSLKKDKGLARSKLLRESSSCHATRVQ